MISEAPLILRLISACVPIANQAGDIIRDVMKTGELNTIKKGSNNHQTEADRRAQEFIICTLSCLFPNITIIGEEDGYRGHRYCYLTIFNERDESILSKKCPEDLLNVTEEQITVWVDPLDGTSEFTAGFLDHVTVLIGIAIGPKAVAGVIHQPYFGYQEGVNISGRTIWGIIGLGAHGCLSSTLPSDCLILTTMLSRSNSPIQQAINCSLKPDQVLRVGGAGYKVLLLLDGKAHAYIFPSKTCKRWDTCAPEAVLRAAGGQLTDINGEYYSYTKGTNVQNSGGVFATARKEDHTKFINLLPEKIKQSLKC